MADRVLPSRDAEYWPAFVTMLEEEGLDGAATVFEAWWSGRLVDREAIEKKQLIEQFVGTLDERERYLHDAEFHALIEVLVVTLLDLPNADLDV